MDRWVGSIDEPRRYRIAGDDFLARVDGGQSMVFRAADHADPVAVKVMTGVRASDHDEFAGRVTAFATVGHQGLVAPSAVFRGAAPTADPSELDPEDYDTTVVVEPWVDGPTLTDAAPDLDLSERLGALTALCEAVDYLHRFRSAAAPNGIVHRDIKPSNVILAPTGAVLIDFGVARPTPDGPDQTRGIGTFGWRAPETLDGGGVSAPRDLKAADRWAVGAVAHWLITGERPGMRGDGHSSLRHLVEGAERLGVADPQQFCRQLILMLADDEQRRPEDLEAWAARLRHHATSRPTSRNRRVLVALVGVLAVSLAWVATRPDGNNGAALADTRPSSSEEVLGHVTKRSAGSVVGTLYVDGEPWTLKTVSDGKDTCVVLQGGGQRTIPSGCSDRSPDGPVDGLSRVQAAGERFVIVPLGPEVVSVEPAAGTFSSFAILGEDESRYFVAGGSNSRDLLLVELNSGQLIGVDVPAGLGDVSRDDVAVQDSDAFAAWPSYRRLLRMPGGGFTTETALYAAGEDVCGLYRRFSPGNSTVLTSTCVSIEDPATGAYELVADPDGSGRLALFLTISRVGPFEAYCDACGERRLAETTMDPLGMNVGVVLIGGLEETAAASGFDVVIEMATGERIRFPIEGTATADADLPAGTDPSTPAAPSAPHPTITTPTVVREPLPGLVRISASDWSSWDRIYVTLHHDGVLVMDHQALPEEGIVIDPAASEGIYSLRMVFGNENQLSAGPGIDFPGPHSDNAHIVTCDANACDWAGVVRIDPS